MSNADTKPGEYYVTVVDGNRYNFLLGPFTNDHQAALDHVEAARKKAQELDPRSAFYTFGTARLPSDDSVPIRCGRLNRYFNLPIK